MRSNKLWVLAVTGALVLGSATMAEGTPRSIEASNGSSLKQTLAGRTPASQGTARGATNGYDLRPPTWRELQTTSQSHPFGGDAWNAMPIGLAQYGFVEEEFLVSGAARVYDAVPGSDFAVTSSSSSDYTTRALVRRPANLKRWSGDVVVEYMNATDGFGAPINWPRIAPDILANNDVYVGFVGKPNAFPILQEFDASRYGELSMANPVPVDEQTCGTLPDDPDYNPNLSKLYENGLLWDMLSGIGLSFDSGRSPLGRPAKRVYAAGESQSAIALYAYYMWFGGNRTTFRGQPVFDGYLAETGWPLASPKLNQCAEPLPADDVQLNLTEMPRRGAPFFAVNSQWDTPEAPMAPSSQYRLWSVTGADHVDKNLMDRMWPIRPDLVRGRAAGPDAFPWQIAYGATLEAFSPAGWFCDDTSGPEVGLPQVEAQAFRLLKKWATTGARPPIAPYLERDGAGELVVDADGNARGGLRLPLINAPIATYHGGFWGDCADVHVPFSQERLQQLYGDQDGYVQAVAKEADVAVKRGYISRRDAARMVLDAQSRPIP